MSKFFHGLGHGLLIGAQYVAQFSSLVPGKYHPLALAVGGLAQAVLALANHKSPEV